MSQPSISRFFTKRKPQDAPEPPEKAAEPVQIVLSDDEMEEAKPSPAPTAVPAPTPTPTAVPAPPAKRRPSPRPASRPKKAKKLTPLDQQVKDLKLQHMDKILAVQVGYKYKFFAQDAVKVHQLLNIMLVPGKINLMEDQEDENDKLYDKLAYCSIPDNRLAIHLQNLLKHGFKVGIVDQLETSAIKSASSGSSSLFKREVSKVLTKATYIDLNDVDESKQLNSIIAINEDASANLTIVCIQPMTGEIIYDQFADDYTRSSLETRLLHLEPIEFLYFEDTLSPKTTNVIRSFVDNHQLTKIRQVSVPKQRLETLNGAYLDEHFDSELAHFIHGFSHQLQATCALLVDYLKEFELDSCFQIRSNYKTFANQNHMLLNANTLQNLEIFANSTNGEQHGSLLWLMDHTRTKFGFRMLREWISRPLVNRELIQLRLASVEYLKTNFNIFLEAFAGTLRGCPDLSKYASKLNCLRIRRKELYLFLFKLSEFSRVLVKFGRAEVLSKYLSSEESRLRTVFAELTHLLLELDLDSYLNLINSQYAMDDQAAEDHVLKYFNLHHLRAFVDTAPIEQQVAQLADIDKQLVVELRAIRQLLKRPSLNYTEVSGEPYLIEVSNAKLGTIPKDWTKINATKSLARFRSPAVAKLCDKMLYHKDLLVQANETTFRLFLQKLNLNQLKMSRIIANLAEFDCLLSLSAVSSNVNYTKPKFVDSSITEITNGRNPIIEQLTKYVPTNLQLQPNKRCLIITGPNMGGKSSFVKQVGLISIMAQIGCYVPADSAVLGIFNSIETRMGSFDNLVRGESTFKIEMLQVLNILKNVSRDSKNLIILDEVGRGTSTVDGIAIGTAILQYLLAYNSRSLIFFITHFPSISRLSLEHHEIANFYMDYLESHVEGTTWPTITFLYNLVEGVSANSYGLNVAKLALIDDDIISKAFEVSRKRQLEIERNVQVNKAVKLLKAVETSLHTNDINSLTALDI